MFKFYFTIILFHLGILNVHSADIVNRDEYKNALIAAIDNSDSKTSVFLINRGVPVHLKMPDGEPLLHRAIKVFSDTPRNKDMMPPPLELIKLIIRKGSDVNLEDENGITPLMVAKRCASERVVELLKDAGAKDFDPKLPINLARAVKIDADIVYWTGDYCIAVRHDLFPNVRKRIEFSLLKEEIKARHGKVPIFQNGGKDVAGNPYILIYDTTYIHVVIHSETVAKFKDVVPAGFWKPFRPEFIEPFMKEPISDELLKEN